MLTRNLDVRILSKGWCVGFASLLGMQPVYMFWREILFFFQDVLHFFEMSLFGFGISAKGLLQHVNSSSKLAFGFGISVKGLLQHVNSFY